MHVSCLASELARLSEKSKDNYKVIIFELDRTFRQACALDNQISSNEGKREATQIQNSLDEEANTQSENNILDPCISQTKGRKKDNDGASLNRRIKNGPEVYLTSVKKKKRRCKIYGQGHN
ncbi:hypothetical protein Droror1_Dr00024865 [Drosera rotundifolia]